MCAWQGEWLATPLGTWLTEYERLFLERERLEQDRLDKENADLGGDVKSGGIVGEEKSACVMDGSSSMGSLSLGMGALSLTRTLSRSASHASQKKEKNAKNAQGSLTTASLSRAVSEGIPADANEPQILPNHVLYYHGNAGASVFLQPHLYRAIEVVSRDAAAGKFPNEKKSDKTKSGSDVAAANVAETDASQENPSNTPNLSENNSFCPSLPLLPLPTTLKLPIIDVERLTITPDIKKRYPMCSHLPIGTETFFVTCDILKIFPKSWHCHPSLQQARQRIQEKVNAAKAEEKKHKEWQKQRNDELSLALLRELEKEELYGRSTYWTEERPGANDMDSFPSFGAGAIGDPVLGATGKKDNQPKGGNQSKKNAKTSRWSNVASTDTKRLQTEEWTPLGFF